MAFLAIDVGGTYLKSAVVDPEGNIYQDSAFTIKSSSDGSREEILDVFQTVVSNGLEFIKDAGKRLLGIGVASPGPFNIYKGTPLMKHKFQGIYGLNLRACFYEFPGISSGIPIKFIHDANAVLAGEAWRGNALGFKNAAVVTLGTGLGFAFSQKRIIQYNEIGGPGISIFKLPYREGILEDYTSKRGFLKIYRELSRKKEIRGVEVSDISQWAQEGDEASMQTFHEVGKILAESLEHILLEKDIQCLLFGGQISRSFHLMEQSLKESLKNIEYLHKISAVKSIDDAALLGAHKAIIGQDYLL